ncbi:MAG TPA: hypothetical protein PKK11_01725 [Methanothrix sp.]|nr:hypothetical protein [Methanothrix sp.]
MTEPEKDVEGEVKGEGRHLWLPKEILVGRKIRAGSRYIWPVIEALFWKSGEDRVLIAHLRPLALLVIEEKKEYALSFSGQPLTVAELLEMAPELCSIREEARGTHRIEIV